METRAARIKELQDILLTRDGLAKVIELHKLVCGHYPRMELSPNQILVAIADCEYEQRTGQPVPCE